LAGDLRKMPKPKSQKKESKSINLKEDDLSSSDAKNEIKKEGLDIEEPVGFKNVKEPKNKFNSFFLIVVSSLATASFGLAGAFLINNYYPNFFKNKSQILFEQDMQVRLEDLATSIKKLEIDSIEAIRKTENFVSEKELVANLTRLESQIIKNKEEFDLKSFELGNLQKKLEAKFSNIDNLETETRSMAQAPLHKKEEKDAPKQEVLGVAKDSSKQSIKTDQSIQENLRVIRNSTIYGIPYKKNLENIELILDLKAPEILRNLSETGIPTMKDLSESFPKFARMALSADRNEQETEDFKFLTFLKSQFQARSTIPRQGSDPDAVLSRSEAFLKTNDLEKSLFELTQLDGIALKVMEPWRISAENRINSLLAVEQLVQSIEK
jgi:hypothetical protein